MFPAVRLSFFHVDFERFALKPCLPFLLVVNAIAGRARVGAAFWAEAEPP